MYVVVGEEQHVARTKLQGTIQNDILKEYIARGTYIYPPEPSLRLVADNLPLDERGGDELQPHLGFWLPHARAGATAAEEVGVHVRQRARVRAARGPSGARRQRIRATPFILLCGLHRSVEEVAKFRAARRLWARLMREKFQATEAASRLRFHTQTGGATLTAQQPLNNVVRVAIQAMAAVLGGTQSLHTNSYDEALSLPTTQSATLALRTQQLLAHETGVPDVVDPLAGSWYVESLTDSLETRGAHPDRRDRAPGRGGAGDRARLLPGTHRRERIHPAAGHRGREAGRRGRKPVRHR